MPNFYNRNRWGLTITIGGSPISQSMIHGDVIIEMGENESNTTEFTIITNDPITLIDSIYNGASEVVIKYYNASGIYRLITAIVDTPKIDIVNRYVRIICSNQRDELIQSKMQYTVKTLGRYSPQIQGDFESVKEEVALRLKSTPQSINFDNYNNLNINSWYAKASADFVFTQAQVYRRTPSVDWQDRSNIINNINIVLKYKRTRLYHQQRSFGWEAPYFSDEADFTLNQYSAPNVAMIESAIEQTSWKKIGVSVYTDSYVAIDVPASLQPFASYDTPYYPVLSYDSAGNVLTDSSGNSLYKKLNPVTLQTFFVMKADWAAAIRFSQFIEEQFTMNVYAPQSTARDGLISTTANYGYEDSYDASKWEQYERRTPAPAGATVSEDNYYVDLPEIVPGTLNNAILTTLEIAKTDILATHRNTQVVVELDFQPTLQLRHTVQLATDVINCKGRVVKISHKLDCINGDKSTEITIALFRSTGSASDTSFSSPTRPSYSYPGLSAPAITLGSHYGQIPEDTPGSDVWNGFIGTKINRWTVYDENGDETGTRISRPAVTDEFRVDTPEVIRTMATVYATPTSYSISIPNDPFTMDLSSLYGN